MSVRQPIGLRRTNNRPSPGNRRGRPFPVDLDESVLRTASDVGRRLQGPGSDLVEARAAVDRSVIAWGEWHHRLAAATAADRRVEFARSSGRSGPLGDRTARRAPLRIVEQALAGEECLLAAGEDELLRAIATGQRSVLVHPLRTLLWCAMGRRCGPRTSTEIDRAVTGAQCAIGLGSDSNPKLLVAENSGEVKQSVATIRRRSEGRVRISRQRACGRVERPKIRRCSSAPPGGQWSPATDPGNRTAPCCVGGRCRTNACPSPLSPSH